MYQGADQEKTNKLFAFLKQSKQNLLVKSDLESHNQDLYDISKNLFKVLCAILGLYINQKGTNYLDDKLLVTYLDTINFHRDDPDLVLIDQLATIKSLVNRKSFTMTQKQVQLV